MLSVQPITFRDNFIKKDKFKGASAKFVHEVLNSKIDNVSNKEILEKLPFDVEVCRKNKSHKAIHPEITFYIDYEQFWGKQSYYVEHGAEDAILKMRKWFFDFNKYIEGKKKLTPKEENDRIYDYIRNMGKFKRYKPLQRPELQ